MHTIFAHGQNVSVVIISDNKYTAFEPVHNEVFINLNRSGNTFLRNLYATNKKIHRIKECNG